VESMLNVIGVLQDSRIGHYDLAAGVTYSYFPKNCNLSFNDHAVVIIKMFADFGLPDNPPLPPRI